MERNADRVEQAIYDACAFVAESPMRGHVRRDLTPRLRRFWTLTQFPSYTVVYDPQESPLQIIAVVHGMRNVRRILRERQR